MADGTPPPRRGAGSGAAGGLLVAPLAAARVQLNISGSREYLADEAGASISGEPEAIARAVRKLKEASKLILSKAIPATASLFIVNPFGATQTVSRWFSTHPQTHERVERLLAMAHPRRGVLRQPYLANLVREW